MKRRSWNLAMLVALLVVVLCALAMPATAWADEYKYKVRVFPGNRGTLSADPVEVEVAKDGDVDLYDIATAKITDKKYVQTGFRLSGTEKTYVDGKVRNVGEDMDFVVAYGVEANTVQYTIKYVEYQTGRELAKPKTYYGTVGDKPVATYEYIEGYRPLYLAITGTLHKDEENVWTFEYVALAEGETIVTTTTTQGPTVVRTEYETVEGGDQGTTAEGQNQDENAPTEGNEGTEGAGDNQNAGDEGTEGTENAEPETQEILDLDTPLAGPESTGSKIVNDALLLSAPAKVAASVVCLAVIGGAAAYLIKRKKETANGKE